MPTRLPGSRHRVLLVFVDGVGIGPDDPVNNPLATARMPHLHALLGGRRPVATSVTSERLPLAPLDATLGVDGLPQSGSGQTALLTGVNAPAAVGRHVGPYPDKTLREILRTHSIWQRLVKSGHSVALANAYPDRYLDRVARGTARMGAIARSASLAGVTLRGPGHLRDGRAVSAFLTNEAWRSHLGYDDMPLRTEREAGEIVSAVACRHDLTVFEYYATDIVGHRGTIDEARGLLERLDAFLGGVVSTWPSAGILILASDHGNIEDMATRRHTRNPALGAWHGPVPPQPRLCALTDVVPAVADLLDA